MLHGFITLTGQVAFSGAGTAMNGLNHFATILAARNHFYDRSTQEKTLGGHCFRLCTRA
jgi:hypothetical protein